MNKNVSNETNSETVRIDIALKNASGDFGGRVLPFMLTPENEKLMFDEWCDGPYSLHAVLIPEQAYSVHTKQEDYLALQNRLKTFLEGASWESTNPDQRTFEFENVVLSKLDAGSSLLDCLTVKQRRWFYNGWYLQVGFGYDNDGFDFSPGRGIGTAMTLHDANVAGSGSLNPEDHYPKMESWHVKRDLANSVGYVFHEGECMADFNSVLIGIRNEVLIKAGAWLRGLEPQKEYDAFVASGNSYFLDHTWSTK